VIVMDVGRQRFGRSSSSSWLREARFARGCVQACVPDRLGLNAVMCSLQRQTCPPLPSASISRISAMRVA
jgi:hypothetical protein